MAQRKKTYKQIQQDKERAVKFLKARDAIRFSAPVKLWRNFWMGEMSRFGRFEGKFQKMNIVTFGVFCVGCGIFGIGVHEVTRYLMMQVSKTHPWMIEYPTLDIVRNDLLRLKKEYLKEDSF